MMHLVQPHRNTLLELLLQGTGRNARCLVERVVEELGELLDGVRIMLLAPTLGPEHREGSLAGMSGTPATAEIPI
jgi:hypothetical protein